MDGQLLVQYRRGETTISHFQDVLLLSFTRTPSEGRRHLRTPGPNGVQLKAVNSESATCVDIQTRFGTPPHSCVVFGCSDFTVQTHSC